MTDLPLISSRGCPQAAWSLPHVPAMTPVGISLMHGRRDGVSFHVHACKRCGFLYYTSEKVRQ